MPEFRVAGRSAATAATANHVAACLWNPSATLTIFVTEVHVCLTAATAANLSLRKTSTRGTPPAGSVVATIDNSHDSSAAPASGAVLDLAAFTAQPTLVGVPIERWALPAAIGAAGMFVFPNGIA